ncbi:MAG: hypothetical protein JXA07_16955 [Spirochaetes bacterium]|nr:hypothetical protein [Spirochaetota bacterium]
MTFSEKTCRKFFLYGLAVTTRLISDLPFGLLAVYLFFQRKGMDWIPAGLENSVYRLLSDVPIAPWFIENFIQKDGSGGLYDALANAGIFTAFCSVHSFLARDFTKKIIAKAIDTKYIRSLYSIIAGITLFLLIYSWRPLTGTLWATSGILFWIITAMYCGVLLLFLITMSQIDYMDFLGIRSLLREKGDTPAISYQFTVRGIFAHCRHPLYLITIASFWIAPVMTYERLEFTILATFYFIIGAFFEERNMQRDLGAVYSQYKKHVPMWIPRITPWRPDRQSSLSADG